MEIKMNSNRFFKLYSNLSDNQKDAIIVVMEGLSKPSPTNLTQTNDKVKLNSIFEAVFDEKEPKDIAVIKYLNVLDNPLDLPHKLSRRAKEDIAKNANADYSYIYKTIKKETGLTEKYIALHLTLLYARFEIINTDRELKEIADEFGFEDKYVYFTKSYKLHLFESPNDTRNKFRKKGKDE